MVYLKSEEDINIIRESARILALAHGEVARMIAPGVTTLALDKRAEDFIKDNGGVPSFLKYKGFPASICTSVNETVVHGIPSKYVLKEGDIVSVDCGVKYKGFHSDSAYTYPMVGTSKEVLNMLNTTYDALYLGIEMAKVGNRIGDVSYAIQTYVENSGYGVVRELVGHGIGKNLHEAPEIPNYGKKGHGAKIVVGMVLAIEPMINLGTPNVVQEDDGWTINTKDRKPSAHFEHTVAVFKDRTEILTTHKDIEENYSYSWRNKIQ